MPLERMFQRLFTGNQLLMEIKRCIGSYLMMSAS